MIIIILWCNSHLDVACTRAR